MEPREAHHPSPSGPTREEPFKEWPVPELSESALFEDELTWKPVEMVVRFSRGRVLGFPA